MNSAIFIVFAIFCSLINVVQAESDTASSPVNSYVIIPAVGGVLALVVLVAMCMKGGSAGGKPEGSSDKKPSNNPTSNSGGTSSGAASNKPEGATEANSSSQPQGQENYESIRDFKAAMKQRQMENP